MLHLPAWYSFTINAKSSAFDDADRSRTAERSGSWNDDNSSLILSSSSTEAKLSPFSVLSDADCVVLQRFQDG